MRAVKQWYPFQECMASIVENIDAPGWRGRSLFKGGYSEPVVDMLELRALSYSLALTAGCRREMLSSTG